MIVGPCSPETKSKLTNLSKKLGVESNILFTGEKLPQGTDMLPLSMAACDVFVFRSHLVLEHGNCRSDGNRQPVIVPIKRNK